MTEQKTKYTKADVDYYRDKWMDTLGELTRLQESVRTLLELAKIPIHEHEDDE